MTGHYPGGWGSGNNGATPILIETTMCGRIRSKGPATQLVVNSAPSWSTALGSRGGLSIHSMPPSDGFSRRGTRFSAPAARARIDPRWRGRATVTGLGPPVCVCDERRRRSAEVQDALPTGAGLLLTSTPRSGGTTTAGALDRTVLAVDRWHQRGAWPSCEGQTRFGGDAHPGHPAAFVF